MEVAHCFKTTVVTTSESARLPGAERYEYDHHHSNIGETKALAEKIVRRAIESFEARKGIPVYIPPYEVEAEVGFSVEYIHKRFGSMRPLADAIKDGRILGVVNMVGCNNPKVRPDTAHIEMMKKLLENDIIVVVSGCSAQAAAKAGLMDPDAAKYCGEGLKRVCELVDIPPILHMGSCVDISRMMILAADIAKDWGIDIDQVPVVGCAPEYMSEKAVSIGNYVVATGIDTFLGVNPYTKGGPAIEGLLQGSIKDWVGANFTVELDIEKMGDDMIERIEEKRVALGI
jgi:carbon-monoxide dehydrogenase catalytic subunit